MKLTLYIQSEPVSERQQAILSIMKQNLPITREDLGNQFEILLTTLKRKFTSLRKVTLLIVGVIKNGQ